MDEQTMGERIDALVAGAWQAISDRIDQLQARVDELQARVDGRDDDTDATDEGPPTATQLPA